MAFKLAVSETYPHAVIVQLPGEKTPRKLELDFYRLSQAQLTDLSARSRAGEIDDKQFGREVVAGWSGKAVTDEAGDAIEFNASALEQLLEVYPVPASIVTAFYESIGGAKQKN